MSVGLFDLWRKRSSTSIYIIIQALYGIGKSNSIKICQELGYKPNAKANDLFDYDFENIESYIERTQIYGSLLSNFLQKSAEGEKNINSYRGRRLLMGLPIRGQRTHSNASIGKTKRVKVRPKIGEKTRERIKAKRGVFNFNF